MCDEAANVRLKVWTANKVARASTNAATGPTKNMILRREKVLDKDILPLLEIIDILHELIMNQMTKLPSHIS